MGPELMNCCGPEPMGTQGHGKMLLRNQNWRFEGQKRRIIRKEYRRLLNKFEMECFYGAKRIVESCERKILRERGALPKEEGDAIREYKAMHVQFA